MLRIRSDTSPIIGIPQTGVRFSPSKSRAPQQTLITECPTCWAARTDVVIEISRRITFIT